MSDYRFQLVKRHESHTGNEIDCLHVMIDSNSLKEIADTYIPLDDILEAAVASGMMTHPKNDLEAIRDIVREEVHNALNPPEQEQIEPESPFIGNEQQ